MRRLALTAAILAASAAGMSLPAVASAAPLRAGVGVADVTPRLGYYLGGWTRADRVAQGAKRGFYRMVVRAKRYRLVSKRFKVRNSKLLALEQAGASAGRLAVAVHNPPARRDIDLTHRPRDISGGVVRFRVGGRTVVVRRKRGGVFSVRAPAGRSVTVLSARDRYGNVAAEPLRLR